MKATVLVGGFIPLASAAYVLSNEQSTRFLLTNARRLSANAYR